MKQMPWFRVYTEAVDDEKLRLLAFEDRWHFVALLCCKGQGILDDPSRLLKRKIAIKLGLDLSTLDEVARRLSEVGLIDKETLQPIKWNERQFKSDSSAERTKAYRDRLKRHRDVTVTAQETDTESDTESDTNTEKTKPAASETLIPKPTNAGLYCRSMMKNGIQGCNPSHPTLLALINAGATEEEFVAAAKNAAERGKASFSYVVGTVKRQREEAAELILHKGRMPTKLDLLDHENKESTMRAKARLFGSPTEKDVTNETTRL
jgi:hypothetical protein